MVDNSTAVQQMRDSVKNMNLFRSIDGGTYDFKIILPVRLDFITIPQN